jgi:hypothetical protein
MARVSPTDAATTVALIPPPSDQGFDRGQFVRKPLHEWLMSFFSVVLPSVNSGVLHPGRCGKLEKAGVALCSVEIRSRKKPSPRAMGPEAPTDNTSDLSDLRA